MSVTDQPVVNGPLTFQEVSALCIAKNETPSRYTNGKWCSRCYNSAYKTFTTQNKVEYVFQIMGAPEHLPPHARKPILEAACPNCLKLNYWDVLGYADPDFEPESSFVCDRDYQRSKTYNWEDAYFKLTDFNELLSKTDTIILVGQVMKDFNVPFEDLKLEDDRGHCVAYSYTKIQLSRDPGRKPYIILHECAHILNQWLIHNNILFRESSHGANWMGIYIHLLNKYLGISKTHLVNDAMHFGVQVTFPEPIENAFFKLKRLQNKILFQDGL